MSLRLFLQQQDPGITCCKCEWHGTNEPDSYLSYLATRFPTLSSLPCVSRTPSRLFSTGTQCAANARTQKLQTAVASENYFCGIFQTRRISPAPSIPSFVWFSTICESMVFVPPVHQPHRCRHIHIRICICWYIEFSLICAVTVDGWVRIVRISKYHSHWV